MADEETPKTTTPPPQPPKAATTPGDTADKGPKQTNAGERS